jgi:acetyl esterase/lipase
MFSKKKMIYFICSLLLVLVLAVIWFFPRLPASVEKIKNIQYARLASGPLLLDIYRPKNFTGKLPVIVWLYGGGWQMGSKTFCPVAYMAAQNYAVISINYRLSGVAPFPAQIFDCKGAVRWLRAHAEEYHFDADHIGIFGASAGGHLGELLGTTAGNPQLEGDVGGNLNYSSRVQAVCAFYAPADLDLLVTNVADRNSGKTMVGKLLGGPLNDHLALAALASPLRFVSPDSAPFFLLHGEKDTLVPVQQSELFYDALKKAGVEAQLVIVPGKGHGILAPPAAAQQIYKFFNQHLKPGSPARVHP